MPLAPVLRRVTIALLCAVVTLVQHARAQDAAEAARRAAAVLEEGGCQAELPGDGPRSADERNGGSGGAGRERDRAPGDRTARSRGEPLRLGSSTFGLGATVFWIFAGVVLAILIVAIVRSIGERTDERGDRATVSARLRPPPTAPPLPEPEDYEQLAANGDFAAAIHALLQHALHHLAAQTGGISRSTTGREALQLADALPDGQPALRGLVLAAERVHFGDAPADRSQFDASRHDLEQWRRACRVEA